MENSARVRYQARKGQRTETMRVDSIPIGTNPPFDINVLVEVPIGGEPIKYELDKASGTMFVDRMLYTSMHYPGNYGFIPHTLSDDGDPLDVLIANSRPIVPGAVCNCRPVGVLFMKDEAGHDEKIIAVPSDKVSPIYRKIRNYADLPEMMLSRIAHFYEHYKDLELGKWVKIDRWGDEALARDLIVKSIEAAKAKKA
jgi:inorganic pyrophosphatase